MKTLIISEKSNAAARIATILSNGNYRKRSSRGVPVFQFTKGDREFTVVGLRGHIVELDYPKEMRDWSRVDPKELVYAPPVKRVTAGNLIELLRDLARNSDELIIATDYDREGELIGLETVRMVDASMEKVKRARFSALTKQEIEAAFQNLTLPDDKQGAEPHA